ncbi:BlaI/MecI/CopY family transcriptional regulator [Verrucomicrobia bacterium]|nr:BlaI/MecI/CopY family transcriptional regulator [Verrucomicrobiota bacterium]
MTKPTKPSNQETVILTLLWEQESMTAREVMEAMPDGKTRAYTSILSVLQAMERKGLVDHTTVANTNRYRAVAIRDDIMGNVIQTMVKNLFGGNPSAVMQSLLQETEIGDEDVKEMERLLRQHKKNKSAKKG